MALTKLCRTLEGIVNSDQQNKGFNIKQILFKSLGYWYLYLIGVVIGAGIAFYKVRYYVPQYSVNARILVKDEYSSWGQEYFLPGMELVSSRNRLINEVGVIKSFPVMKKVMESIPSFQTFYYDHGNIKVGELYGTSPFEVILDTSYRSPSKLEGRYYFLEVISEQEFRLSRTEEFQNPIHGKFGERMELAGVPLTVEFRPGYHWARDKTYGFVVNDKDRLAKFFQSSTGIVPENKESSILVLSRKGTNVQKEIDFLNALIENYIQIGLHNSSQIASNTIEFVDEQIISILDTLIIAESKLQRFKSDMNVNRMPLEEQTSLQELATLERDRIDKELAMRFFSQAVSQIEKDERAVISIPSVMSDDIIVGQISSLNELYEEQYAGELALTEDNAKTRQLKNEIGRLQESVLKAIQIKMEMEEAELGVIKDQIKLLEGKLMNIPGAEREFINLTRTYQLNSDLYTYLLKKKSEAAIAKASAISKVQVLDYASHLRVSYIGQDSLKLYLMYSLLGFMLPLALVVIIDYFDTRITDKQDLTNATDIPILGLIGHNKETDSLVVLNSPNSVVAEAFRSIRTQISFLADQREHMVILISSSISGEGKTFCSMNLASSHAQLGKKTILVGADLRRPKIFGDFGLSNEIGLSDCLIERASVKDAIRKTHIENIDLMTSGPVPPNPSELIGKPRMGQIIEELRDMYDIVIIDTPPLGLVSEALLLQDYVDVNLYIVRQRFTKQGHLEIINEYHLNKRIEHLGIIVNDIKQRKVGYGGYYGYGYGYYGYGYKGEEDAPVPFWKKLPVLKNLG